MERDTITAARALRDARNAAEDRLHEAMEGATDQALRAMIRVAACALGARLHLTVFEDGVRSTADCDRIDAVAGGLRMGDTIVPSGADVRFAGAAHTTPEKDGPFDFIVDGRRITLNAGDEHDPYGLYAFEAACEAFLPLVEAGTMLEIASSEGARATLPADAVAILEEHESDRGGPEIYVPMLGIRIAASAIGVRGVVDDGETLSIMPLDGPCVTFRRTVS